MYSFADRNRSQKHSLVKTFNNSPINFQSKYKLDESAIGINLSGNMTK